MRRALAALVAPMLVLTLAAPPVSGEAWRPRVRLAREYAQSRQGSVSFAIKDGHKRFFAYRAKRVVPAASVFKAMILAAYLRRPSVRHRELSEEERDRMGAMIRWSDNSSATILLDRMGHGPVWRLARAANMHRFRLVRPWGLSHIDAAAQVRFFFKYDSYIPERHERYARWLLSHVVPSQRWGIGEVRLDNWKRFFKSGWATGTGRVSHQVTWIEKGERKVAIAVMTEYSPDHAYSTRTLRGVMSRLLRGMPDR
jgi:beta-lactamase class A